MPATAVYAAEEQWCAVLDRGGVVDFFGSTLDVPQQRRFADVASIQRYADAVLGLSAVRAAYQAVGPVRVRERAGQRRAHYEVGAGIVAVPLRDQWAACEAVVLHELAHHLECAEAAAAGDVGGGHGVRFRVAMEVLVGATLGEAAALLLRAGYDAAGVRS